MTTILEETIRLSCLIRDSVEAEQWRSAWNTLPTLWSGQQITDISKEPPFDELIHLVRMTDRVQARPFLFPFILEEYAPESAKDFTSNLDRYPLVGGEIKKLLGCFSVMPYLVSFLRVKGAGFPHENLVYTDQDSPWVIQSGYRELPWLITKVLGPIPSDAQLLGLNKFIPSVSVAVATSLNKLADLIAKDPSYQNLDRAYKVIAKNKNLQKELNSANEHFKKLVIEAQAKIASGRIKPEMVQSITKEVYKKKGDRINNYVDNFLEVEKLIERIYWLLSHIIMNKTISFASTADPEMLQQVHIGLGPEHHITAISPTTACGGIGHIIHLSLPEAGDIFDGLYHITHTHLRYQTGNRIRIFFHAKLLWKCTLSAAQSYPSQTVPPLFIPGDKGDLMEIKLLFGNGSASLGMKDFISFENPRSIYG